MTNTAEPRTARERVYHALKAGAATRPELAARTGLSVPTVITAVDTLIDSGLASLEGTTQSTGGRPPARVRLVPDRFTVAALDLGGPVITSGRYDLAGQRLSYREHGPLPVQRYPNPLLTTDELLGWLREQGPADLCVVSALGVVNPRTRTITQQVLDLRDNPLEAELSAALGWPVIVENEVNLAAWNTWRQLGLTANDPLVYLNYNLGIGVGMMLNGKLYYGATGAAGEISLQAMKESDRWRDQPQRRLLTHLSSALPGGTLTEVAALATHGSEAARRAVSAFTADLANYLTIVAAVIDPAVLVLQDIPNAVEPLREEVQLALEDVGLRTRVMITPLGPLAGLDSAAQYAIAALERARLASVSES